MGANTKILSIPVVPATALPRVLVSTSFSAYGIVSVVNICHSFWLPSTRKAFLYLENLQLWVSTSHYGCQHSHSHPPETAPGKLTHTRAMESQWLHRKRLLLGSQSSWQQLHPFFRGLRNTVSISNNLCWYWWHKQQWVVRISEWWWNLVARSGVIWGMLPGPSFDSWVF